MNLQVFLPVKGFESRYKISSTGEVYSIKAKRLLKPRLNNRGYLCVELWVNYQRKAAKVHRLVAETFVENPNNFKEVNHKDGNKLNNSANNLEWCSRSQNVKHAYAIGLRFARKGVPRRKEECRGQPASSYLDRKD
jgi:hypothetical protein